ncbi:MAG: hypothetical protein V3S64_02790 [bacterium]
MATPFVQGRLRNERISFEIDTECGHCGEPIHLTVNEDRSCRVGDPGQHPLMFEPIVNWEEFSGPHIIDAY